MRKQSAVVASAAGLVLSLFAGMGQASASDICGSACDGKDPAGYLIAAPGGPGNYYHCGDDAITVATKGGSGHPFLELRYSPRCATAWARTPSTGTAAYAIQIRSYYSNGTWRKTYGGTSSGSMPWTPMVNDQNLLARACVHIPYGSWTCTSKY